MTEVHLVRSPEDTRVRILAATRRLLARKGRRGTTTREIADLAAVNEATLFRHFGSKDAMIEACAQYYCGAMKLQELLASLNGDVAADLRRIALALAERLEQVRDMIMMSLVEEETDTAVGAAAWQAPVAIRQIVGEYMAGRVEAGEIAGDPLLLARVFMGMIFAQVITRKRFPEVQYTVEQIVDFQISVFLNGVRK